MSVAHLFRSGVLTLSTSGCSKTFRLLMLPAPQTQRFIHGIPRPLLSAFLLRRFDPPLLMSSDSGFRKGHSFEIEEVPSFDVCDAGVSSLKFPKDPAADGMFLSLVVFGLDCHIVAGAA